MNFLLIGDSKLKILLDESEMLKYRLNSVNAESCDSGFRRNFFKILEQAKEAVGFDVGGDKVLIQFYPLQDGGCEVFVTKLGLLSDASAKMVSRSEKITMLSKRVGLYSFESLDDVIAVCKTISDRSKKEPPRSDLYSAGGRFFLTIDEYGKGGETMEFPFIIEYGTALPRELVPYISEHAELVIKENAVKGSSEL